MKNKTLVLLMFFLTTPFFSNDFVPVNTGIFQMQNTGDSSNDLKYEVFVNNFFICIHEVTQKEWEEIMGNNPSVSKSEAFPVNMVNWYDAVLYCNKRSVREGLTPCYKISDSKRSIEYSVPWESTVIKTEANEIICDWTADGYRLPTEAEWEYAARSEGKEHTFFSGSNNIEEVACYYEYIGASIQAVMQKSPNLLGIYDMSGNVREWCWDWFGDLNVEDFNNPKGNKSGTAKVHRGGGWDSEVLGQSFNEDCSVTKRSAWIPTMKDSNLGFRVVRSNINNYQKTELSLNNIMYAAAALKLRDAETTTSPVLAVMSTGTKVKILTLGKQATIDGITSNWVQVEVQAGVKDRDGKPIAAGTRGWCFGGYLAER